MPSDPFAVVAEFQKLNTNMNFVPHGIYSMNLIIFYNCYQSYPIVRHKINAILGQSVTQ